MLWLSLMHIECSSQREWAQDVVISSCSGTLLCWLPHLKQFEFLSSHTSPILTEFAGLFFTLGLMDGMKLDELPELDNLQNAEADQWRIKKPLCSPKKEPVAGSCCFNGEPLNFANQQVVSRMTIASESPESFVQPSCSSRQRRWHIKYEYYLTPTIQQNELHMQSRCSININSGLIISKRKGML